MSGTVPRETRLGRPRYYGQLDESKQQFILQSAKARKALTNKALAAKFNVSEETVKGVLQRYRERVESTSPVSDQTCLSEQRANP